MKKIKTTYWAATALLAVSYLAYHKLQAGRPESVPAPRAAVAFGA